MKAATIKDVARLAGVSVSTASAALNDKPFVRTSTKQKVREAAAKLNYRPNAIARSLVTNESRLVGLVVPDMADPYFPAIAAGVDEVASRLGYTVILANTLRNAKREAEQIRVLLERRVDGLVFAGGSTVGARGWLDSTLDNLEIVVIDRPEFSFTSPSITIDNVRGAEKATRYLVQLGHRDIAFIGGPVNSLVSQERLRGYRFALQESGLPYREELVVHGDFTPRGGLQAMTILLNRMETRLGIDQPLTAAFIANDQMAIGAMHGVRLAGKKVPGDISIIGFDDINVAAVVEPPLTTMAVPTKEIGGMAMNMLAKSLNGEKLEDNRVVLQPQLIERETCIAR
ncbi:MAG: LacI family transcriptional regulator [Firmicutes bacterium]|nr:LacI family transcriptional regulator [Bacillota bacterium]